MDISKLARYTNQNESQPLIFNPAESDQAEALDKLIQSGMVHFVSDTYEQQLEELCEIRHPAQALTPESPNLLKQFIEEEKKKGPLEEQGRWVYYPWLGLLTHVLAPEEFFEVRTNRNHNFITREEQKRFYDSTIGIAGLSVGNSVALNLVLEGGARHLKIADIDTLSLSNCNRIRAGIQYLGIKKTTVTARQIYELNPYAEVTIFTEGLNDDNIDDFFNGGEPLNLVIDELDNLGIKVLLRMKAKEYGIPLMMATDNGSDGIIDIERHDQENTAFFHGRVGEVRYQDLLSLSKQEISVYAAKIIGPENVHSKMLGSLDQLGKTLVSWPQLGGAALLNGSALSFCARRILNGQPQPTGRTLLSLEQLLVPKDDHEREIEQRKQLLEKMGPPPS